MRVVAPFSAQQIEVIDREAGRRGLTRGAFIAAALEGFAQQEDLSRVPALSSEPLAAPPVTPGEVLADVELLPVSGKAFAMRAGDVLRITQVEARQCVDFNAFSLHDGREQFSAGQTRTQGFRLHEGGVLLSNRARPMMQVKQLPASCVTDLLGARCTVKLYETRFGMEWHTNCHDTLTETLREFGLGADDVHDSFNMWMNTQWDGNGHWWSEWSSGRVGDVVELEALTDVLAAPVICGGGDFSLTSNYRLKPIRVEHVRPAGVGAPEVGPGTLQADPGYRAQFCSYPLAQVHEQVEIPEAAVDSMQQLVAKGRAMMLDEAVVQAVMVWLLRNVIPASSPDLGRFRW
ncbi:MAG TPA: urea carboxylase-associated family protein [Microbacteriaceae bacterium]|nr:urea carboxylase-associated family protein [Microbacteriaceae bacterium]